MNRTIEPPQPVVIDQHYSPQFYAELWGVSPSTVVRWFQDREDVLKVGRRARNGKRTRVELKIPYSVAMEVYREHTRGALK
jgi:predicted transcriptional regulator